MGNVPRETPDDDPMIVNPLVELCAGFISKLNVSLYNYTQKMDMEGMLYIEHIPNPSVCLV
jgi:hypothetical protein